MEVIGGARWPNSVDVAEIRPFQASRSGAAPKAAECVFYARGACRNGDACRFLHLSSPRSEPNPFSASRSERGSYNTHTSQNAANISQDAFSMLDVQDVLPKTTIPCKFFLLGECSRGSRCRFAHVSSATTGDADDCPICLVPVVAPKMFGLLSGCDHAVCLDCIREWRKSDDANEGRHGCPVCRTESNLVIPSAVFATGAEKNEIRATYLTRLSTIPCKLYNKGRGFCRWAPECNFAHLNEDGSFALTEEGLQHGGRKRLPRRRNQSTRVPREITSEEVHEFAAILMTFNIMPTRGVLTHYMTLSQLGFSPLECVQAILELNGNFDDDDDDEEEDEEDEEEDSDSY